MSSEHVEVLRDLSEVCRAAIKAGDWKVDGACDPDAALRRADAAIAALSAPQPPAEAQPVAWSTDKPKRPGVYGVRGFNLCRGPEEQFEAIVSVRLYEGDLICNLHESTSEEDFDRWAPIEDCHDDFEWCEFVPANLPPSAPVGVEAAAGEVIESINRFRDAGTRPGDGTLVHWEATLHRALAQKPAPTLPDVDDDDLTVAYMAGRHDGRKEAQQPAATDISSGHCGDSSGHKQPASVDGESVIIDGRRYDLDTVRTALLGLAADITRGAAQPGGSDNDR